MAITTVARDDISEAATPLLDDVVRGFIDFNSLPASPSKSGCWKSASFIIGVEVAERFAYYGISANLINYLTGPLGQSTATAAKNVNVWNGAAMLLPLLGAFIADSFLGQYRTVIIASLLYILGLGFLSLSAAFHSFNSSNCKNDANNSGCSPPAFEVVAFFVSLYLVACAQGGHKPCVQAFGADQFDEEDEEELLSKSSFFNWWFFTTNVGIFVAQSVLSYIQENLSWELGFGIPCIFMCFALIIFLFGSFTYRFRINNNRRNPFVRIGRMFVRGARNLQSTPLVISSNTNGIDNAKAILRLVPIWCACLGYAVVSAQVSSVFIKQGATMDRLIAYGFKIPAASLQCITSMSIVISVLLYDRVLVPTARAMTKKPTGISMLQRIGAGIFLSIVLMIIAAFVERQRLVTAVEHGLMDEPTAVVPMSVWWLAPQFSLLGIADVFAMVGLQEFFYDQVPNELKSTGLALYLSVFGVGNFLSGFLISIIEKATSGDGNYSWFSNNLNRAHLDYFYWLLASLSAVTLIAYFYFVRSYIYGKNENV